jgi:hydroxyethylthiazole kinase
MPAEGTEMRQRQRRGSTDDAAQGLSAEDTAPRSPRDLPRLTAGVLERLRARRPRVHCITNAVAQAFTANMLLAAGAVPSMTIAADEIADFVGGADALLVNLGTFDAQRRAAVDIAVQTAAAKSIPWLLDPVFVDRARPRAEYARALVGRMPDIVRLNQAEFAALAGTAPDAGALARYAATHHTVVALTGETDCIGDGLRLAAIHNGHALMSRVTAMGCAGSALIAACLAVEDDPWTAAAAGLVALGVAGEIAARQASGPGSFAAAVLDAVYRLDGETLAAQARVT